MILKKINSEVVNSCKDKIVIGFEKSESYLHELCIKYPSLFSQISYILDLKIKNQESIEVCGKIFDILCEERLYEFLDNGNKRVIFVITSDYYREAYEELHTILNNGKIDISIIDDIYFFPNAETEFELSYREKYSGEPLENIIIFRSGPHASSYVKGMDFADNARALFEYMLENKYNDKYELVWFVKNPDDFIEYRKKYKNVSFISFDWSTTDNKKNRDEYYRVLCLAKYIFMTDAYGFCRNSRNDQIRIQLWHGCGYKTRVNFSRCEHRYDYNIVVSQVYKEIHKEIYGLRDDQVVITGYPKQDWLFSPYDKDFTQLLGIKKTNKYIFWLPTFRMADDKLKELNQYELSTETTLPIVGTYQQLDQLNNELIQLDVSLIIKFHPFLKKENIQHFNYSNIIALSNEDLVEHDLIINRLLANADALISDYSSVAVDYLALDRPIAFTLDDVDEYENSRGFVFNNIREWLPGTEIFKFEDFLKFVREIGKGKDSYKEKRDVLGHKMNIFRDANNCKRVLEEFNI